MSFAKGVQVEWEESSGGRGTCYGTIICEDRDATKIALGMNPNPFGHWTIQVDMDPIANYHRACHTAYEMNSTWVSRSVDLHKLRLRGSKREPGYEPPKVLDSL